MKQYKIIFYLSITSSKILKLESNTSSYAPKVSRKKIIFLYTVYCKPKAASLEGDVPHVIDEPGASDVLALVLNRQVAPEHLRRGALHS